MQEVEPVWMILNTGGNKCNSEYIEEVDNRQPQWNVPDLF